MIFVIKIENVISISVNKISSARLFSVFDIKLDNPKFIVITGAIGGNEESRERP